MTAQHPEQRVGVYVDVQNLYYSAKSLYDAKVNFANILRAVVGRRKLVRANAYVIKANIEEQDKFFNALRAIGFEVHEKDLQTFAGGAKKGDWDVGMAVDMIKSSPHVDSIVLITGDGDFIPLVEYLQNHGHQVEVIAFSKSASSRLIERADDFIDLCQKPEKYLIKTRQTS